MERDIEASGTPKMCSVPDCELPISAKGYCAKHYESFRTTGSALGKTGLTKAKGCSVAGCTGVHYGKGFCQKHYLTWRKYGNPLHERVRLPPPLCVVDGCEQPISVRGMCKTHYKQWHDSKRVRRGRESSALERPILPAVSVEAIAKNLARVMALKEMSLQRLSRLAKVSISTLKAILAGEPSSRLTKVQKVAAALGTNLVELERSIDLTVDSPVKINLTLAEKQWTYRLSQRGKRGFIVSIPRWWAQENHLGAGCAVTFKRGPGGTLVLVPAGSTETMSTEDEEFWKVEPGDGAAESEKEIGSEVSDAFEFDSFATFVKNVLKTRGISLADMLKELGIAKGTWAGWKSNNRAPRLQEFVAISKFLEISFDELYSLCIRHKLTSESSSSQWTEFR